MKNLRALSLFGILAFCLQCSREELDRQEDIVNLRAIGVLATPSLASLAPSVNFVFYAMTPKGKTLTFSPYTDPKMRNPLQPGVTPTVDTVTSYGALDLHQISGSYALDPLISAATIPIDPGFSTFDYGLYLTSDGKGESIVGSLVLFHPTHPAYSWQTHNVVITNLKNGQTVSGQNLDLQAKITGRNAEDYRIGWFTSSGSISNRRNISTTSTDMKSGPQTIVVTARGRLTGMFALAVVDVVVE